MKKELRLQVVEAARRMNASGINQGKSGNLSVRTEGGFLVTPTGVPYERLVPEDLALVHPDGAHEGPRAPSSEWRFHRDIYVTRPEANAVVHCHSPYATTLACLRRGIPAFHYEVAFAGAADIACADYATFGTQALSDAALAALAGRRACLLANHGQIAIGANLEAAFVLAEKVEALARMYWQALQIGEPTILDAAEMARVLEKFKDYGRH
ncbi:5-(methylthio)ribulose-1-phosphate aldolase [Usitatibacter palustris]|uniref:5-(Methylthio)ribulose-1-phosphate aldolase n=2 Tax=Usitatibacter palustris TaxID=2732487 RepID=A0A6M4H8J4_9PROT|nr:class II aldolase/adducin family protein [Usitatibacter palustris]QJR16039.1 5-(methylthio)ribulose-1-phosphate aldolase [Usitatibacter palustris]